MKGRTKPDQLVNAQNKHPDFVVQIPEGLYVNCQNTSNFTHQLFRRTIDNGFIEKRIVLAFPDIQSGFINRVVKKADFVR